MRNLCSINIKKFDSLKLLVGSPAKAEFLSKCLFWWQISTYKIRNNENTWFTRTTEELALKAQISESSVTRYLRDFVERGLIEKRVIKRYSKSHGQEIACLHIRITAKLLAIVNTNTNTTNPQPNNNNNNENKPNSTPLTQVDDSGSVNLTNPFLYKDKGFNENNIIVKTDAVNSVNKHKSFKPISFAIEKQIGERVTEEVKNLVKGMMYNLENKSNVRLFDKERLFAEIIFSITNEQQFKGCKSMPYKINIISKLLRQKKWKTPKGFYKFWDVGQSYKDKDDIRERRLREEKLAQELEGVTCPTKIAEIKARFNLVCDKLKNNSETQQTAMHSKLQKQLNELNSEICQEGDYLTKIQRDHRLGEPWASQELIDKQAIRLAALYERQATLENQLETMNAWDLCA